MVIASTCGTSPGHEFDPSFSPKSFFALILYENEHSVLVNSNSILGNVSLGPLLKSKDSIYFLMEIYHKERK